MGGAGGTGRTDGRTEGVRQRRGRCRCGGCSGSLEPLIPPPPPCVPHAGSRDAQLLRELEDEELGKLRGAAEGVGREHDAAEDRGGGGGQAGGGDPAGRGEFLHPHVDPRAHHRDPLQGGRGVRGADGGRAALQELGQVGEREQDDLRAAAAQGRRAQDGLVPGDDQRRGAHPDHDGRRCCLHQGLHSGVNRPPLLS